MKASMQHTQDTIKRLSRVQYNTYCQGQKLMSLVFAMVMLFLSAAGGFSSTTSLVLMFIGCWAFTGMNVPADRRAKKIIELAKGNYPASEYRFEEETVRILGDSQETSLPYSDIFSLICDGPYLYLFLNQESAYMVDLMDMKEEKVQQLKNQLSQKTGLTIEPPGSLMTLNLAKLIKGFRKNNKNTGAR